MFLLLFTNVELSFSCRCSWLKGRPPGTRTLDPSSWQPKKRVQWLPLSWWCAQQWTKKKLSPSPSFQVFPLVSLVLPSGRAVASRIPSDSRQGTNPQDDQQDPSSSRSCGSLLSPLAAFGQEASFLLPLLHHQVLPGASLGDGIHLQSHLVSSSRFETSWWPQALFSLNPDLQSFFVVQFFLIAAWLNVSVVRARPTCLNGPQRRLIKVREWHYFVQVESG